MCFRRVVGCSYKKCLTNSTYITNSNQNPDCHEKEEYCFSNSTEKRIIESRLINKYTGIDKIINILPLISFNFPDFELHASVSHILMNVPLVYGKYELVLILNANYLNRFHLYAFLFKCI